MNKLLFQVTMTKSKDRQGTRSLTSLFSSKTFSIDDNVVDIPAIQERRSTKRSVRTQGNVLNRISIFRMMYTIFCVWLIADSLTSPVQWRPCTKIDAVQKGAFYSLLLWFNCRIISYWRYSLLRRVSPVNAWKTSLKLISTHVYKLVMQWNVAWQMQNFAWYEYLHRNRKRF